MPKQRYGSVQVREISFTEQDVINVLTENAHARIAKSYDFDDENPMIIKDGKGYILRFVQKTALYDSDAKLLNMKPIDDIKKTENI